MHKKVFLAKINMNEDLGLNIVKSWPEDVSFVLKFMAFVFHGVTGGIRILKMRITRYRTQYIK